MPEIAFYLHSFHYLGLVIYLFRNLLPNILNILNVASVLVFPVIKVVKSRLRLLCGLRTPSPDLTIS